MKTLTIDGDRFEFTEIKGGLDCLQRIVGGDIEAVTVASGLVAYINGEGSAQAAR
jgi:hypothetical protein